MENLDHQVPNLPIALGRLKGNKVVIIEKDVDRTNRRWAVNLGWNRVLSIDGEKMKMISHPVYISIRLIMLSNVIMMWTYVSMSSWMTDVRTTAASPDGLRPQCSTFGREITFCHGMPVYSSVSLLGPVSYPAGNESVVCDIGGAIPKTGRHQLKSCSDQYDEAEIIIEVAQKLVWSRVSMS